MEAESVEKICQLLEVAPPLLCFRQLVPPFIILIMCEKASQTSWTILPLFLPMLIGEHTGVGSFVIVERYKMGRNM